MNFLDDARDITGNENGCFVRFQFTDFGILFDRIADRHEDFKDISGLDAFTNSGKFEFNCHG